MIRLRKLTIQGFRGARFDLPLDFTADHRSVSVYGENATGKSTITDALEWFLLGRIDHLWREDCKEEALRNVLLDASDKCAVCAEFSNSALNGTRALASDLKTKTSNTNQDFRAFLERAKAERMFLRHAQITKFIDETKSRKKQEIAAIIGYQAILDFRDTIQGTYNQLRKDAVYLTAKQTAEDSKNKLFHLAGAIIATEKGLFDKANALLEPFKIGVIISDFASYDKALDALRGQIGQPDRAENKLRLNQIKNDCDELIAGVATWSSKKSDFLVKYDELVKNKHAVSQLNIEQFLVQGHKVITAGHFQDQQCPFCLTPYNLDKLRNEVDERIKRIATIREQYDETKGLKTEFVDATKLTHAICGRLTKNCEGLDKFKELAIAIERVGNALSSLADNANEQYAKFEPITISQQTVNDLNELSKRAGQNAKIAQDEADVLQLSDQEKKIIETIEQARDLRTLYRQYEGSARTAKAYEEQILSLSTIFETFKAVQNDALQAVLDCISQDVGKFYATLHPNENVDNVRLRVVGEEGIEFEYKFHGKPTHPPMKYLSESHLNSLGICLFLASAKLFNKESRFLVLDDIVTSFDLGHRRRLLRLLKEEFKDWQIILLTHERLWFDMIKRELAQSGWLFKDVEWSTENGVRLTGSAADLGEFIQEKRKKFDVSNDVRKLLEASLKEICHAVGVRVPFRFNDDNEQRMSGELLSDLRATVNRKSPVLKGNATFSNLEGSNLVATVGSHDNPGDTISSGDIDVALADIDALIDLFRCKDCGRYVEAGRQVAGQNKISCKCGKKELDWK